MTGRERLLTTMAHRQPDRVPLDFRCDEPALREMIEQADLEPSVKDRFLIGDIDTHRFKERMNNPIFAPYHRDTPAEAEITDWGVGGLRHRDSGTNLLTFQIYYPLKDMSEPGELDEYPWPDMTDPFRWRHLEGQIRRSHSAGRPALGRMGKTVIELAYEMRPMERLLLDFYENPRFVERLFEKITAARCVQARILAEHGVDVLMIGDDLATQQSLLVSLQTYRQWIKPCHAKVIAAARAVRPDIPVLYHSDGNVELLIPDLIEIGVTAINPVQPECIDPAMVKDRWGDQLTIWGAVSTQRTLAFGTEADVDAEVARRMEKVAPGGGYVVNFINVAWSPNARKNVLRYLMRVQETGVY